jgi:uncharacterized protein YndB with AHSA1/START domain
LQKEKYMDVAANPPAVIDLDAHTVTRSVFVRASVDRVWDVVTDPAHIVGWFGQKADFEPMRVGARGTLGWDGYGEVPAIVTDFDPKSLFAFTWADPGGDLSAGSSTNARFTLEPAPGGTRLTVVETGFENLSDPARRLEENRDGWNHELDELVAYAESLP